jgi:3-isopropylmalate dehydratase small subunit
MENVIRGRVYKFGDNVNSDIIIPGRYLIYIEPEKLAEHAFEVLGADVPKKLRGYDVFVAGRNFGCGSAREQAATAIMGLGVKAVIASSSPMEPSTATASSIRSPSSRIPSASFSNLAASRSTSSSP